MVTAFVGHALGKKPRMQRSTFNFPILQLSQRLIPNLTHGSSSHRCPICCTVLPGCLAVSRPDVVTFLRADLPGPRSGAGGRLRGALLWQRLCPAHSLQPL